MTRNEKVALMIPTERILKSIFVFRGTKVLLDTDIASLYEVETKVLVQAVKRNIDRFPPDFMFQLNEKEFSELRSQTVTSKWGGRRYLPYAFTEQGVAMLSSVLRSKRAVRVNIEIMRAFVSLRKMLAGNEDLARKIEAMEKKYDMQFLRIFEVLSRLIKSDESNKKRQIGFIKPNK